MTSRTDYVKNIELEATAYAWRHNYMQHLFIH